MRQTQKGSMMATIFVTTNASTGAGSLAQALADAAAGDSIMFSETVFDRDAAVAIATAETIEINKDLTLEGGPFRVRLTASGSGRVVRIFNGANVVLNGFDLVGGVESAASGGGVLIDENSSASLNRCRVVGCDALVGGGLYVGDAATATVCDSAIYGNRATLDGGGVYVSANATLILRGSTVVANTCEVDGADVFAADDFREVNASNSIVGVAERADSETLFAAENDAGNVITSALAEVGFVAPPVVAPTAAGWTASAWESWDFHLLDDGSASPSIYRNAGALTAIELTRYDLDGNFRGRTATVDGETVETRSPGCFETIQADFFWIGKDSLGETVAAPSFASADGWAASRFATVSGANFPAANNDFFIGKNVAFVDYPPSETTFGKVFLCGGTVASTPARTGADPTRSLRTGGFFCGVGAFLDGAATQTNKYRFSVVGDAFLGAFSSLGACISFANSSLLEKKYFADVGTRLYCVITGALSLPSETFYETISISRVGEALAEGVLRCGNFILTTADVFNPGYGVVYAKYFYSSVSTGTASSPLTVFFESAGNSANAAKSDPNVSFVLLNGADATLNLNGHKVSGDGGTVSLAGSAAVDGSLNCATLTLNADAELALEGGRVRASSLTTAAGTVISGTGKVELSATGTWTDSGATIGGVSGANYDATNNDVTLELFDPDFESPTLKVEDANVCLTSKSFNVESLSFIFEKYASGSAGISGAYATLYDSSTPVTDETATVYEKTLNWSGTTKRTLVDTTASEGWNFYRVAPKAPLIKGNASLYFNASETRRAAIWKGADEPPTTYYYRGGDVGSFENASDWALTADGVAEFDGAPVFAEKIVDFPTSATVVSGYPLDAPPTRIDVAFPNRVALFDANVTPIDDAPLVSTGVPAPTNLAFYVGAGGTFGNWTAVDGATRYLIKTVENAPLTFESNAANWSETTPNTAKTWRVRVAAPVYGSVENWSNSTDAATPLVRFAEKTTETTIGARSFDVVYATGFPGDFCATIKRRRVSSGNNVSENENWTTLDATFNATEFSDLPPTVDEYVYRVEWNPAPNVWLETTAALWDVGALDFIAQARFATPDESASESPTFLARVSRKINGQTLRRQEIRSIRYSIFENRAALRRRSERAIRENVAVPNSTLRDSLLTDSRYWTRDQIGCNFVFTPDDAPLFPEPGEYVVKIAFETVDSERGGVEFRLTAR